MDDESRDDELGRRLERHLARARGLGVDVSQITQSPSSASRPQAWSWLSVVAAIGTISVIAAAVFIGSDLVERIREPAAGTGELPPLAASVAPRGSETPTASPGCGPPEVPHADPNFTPVANRRGPATPPPLLETGQVITSVDEIPAGFDLPTRVPDGLSLRLILNGFGSDPQSDAPPAPLQLFYSDEPVTGNYVDFLASGGVVVMQNPEHLWDARSIARSFDDEMDDGYSLMELGPYDTFVHLADPVVRDDLRPWHLYWHDGTMDWSIVGIADPIALIEMGQSLYCP